MSVATANHSFLSNGKTMNRSTHPLKESLDNGWSVQIYSRDRHLLCSFYPSHAWTLLLGIALGFALALVGLTHQSTTRPSPVESAPVEAPLRLE
jgi:hypothetical protein